MRQLCILGAVLQVHPSVLNPMVAGGRFQRLIRRFIGPCRVFSGCVVRQGRDVRHLMSHRRQICIQLVTLTHVSKGGRRQGPIGINDRR